MNEFAIARGDERTRDLQRDIERSRAVNRAFPANSTINGLTLDQFHCVKIFVSLAAEVENRSDIAVTELCGSARFGQETRTTRFIRQEPRMNYFECHLAMKICIKRLVGH